ncbi:thiamine phosphate synthase [Novosphingobium profundi]|uniref:thiamine phosphate synthase n=1 Tax=Novosphingobium profundi TaxID=1774954 RepID=UPI001BDA5988|nr:thiamine phosphate synthase [Novosphingobium profundi]MBT0667816.1 thiamine phosphate synthase [Novosphingobium profundi]
MARCYSVPVRNRHPSISPARPQPRTALPRLWLVSDARNDAALEAALARLPRGQGLIYRHYHLPPPARRARFEALKRVARAKGHWLVLAGCPRQARRWGADGAYGSAHDLLRGGACLRLASAHDPREIRRALAARADAVLLSPVFATRSHPGQATLGPARFHLMAAQCPLPVIALGGMTARRAQAHRLERWAAIDGLSGESPRPPTA